MPTLYTHDVPPHHGQGWHFMFEGW
jgi:hypothetical protein